MISPTTPGVPIEAGSSNLFFARRTLFAMVGLLTVIAVAMIGSLLYVAWQLNKQEAEHSQRLIEQIWHAREQSITTTLKDNAFWGDAYLHLHVTPDADWAFVRGNLGASLFTDFQFEGVFVVNGDNRTTYAVIAGELAERPIETWLGAFPKRLIEDARSGGPYAAVATQMQPLGEHPVLLSAAALTTGDNPDVEETEGAQSVLVFAYRLTPAKLNQWGATYEITNLRIPTGAQDAAAAPAVRKPGIVLRWDPDRPGARLIQGLLPVLLIFLACLALVTFGVFRRSFRDARLMDTQFELISAGRAALVSSQERFRSVAEAASDWLWETDDQLRITYLSERFHQVTGHLPADWLGRSIEQMLLPQGQTLAAWIQGSQAVDDRRPLRCTHRAADGTLRTSTVAVRPIQRGESIVGYLGTASDITREVETQDRLLHLSRHDALTGLPNRPHMQAFLHHKLRSQPTREAPVVMFNLDLDNFKSINDVFGHSGGDIVLKEVGRRLGACVSAQDLLARQGGDEFILVTTSLTSLPEIERLCRRLIDRIAQPFTLSGQEVFIGLSIGVAICPAHSSDAEDLLRFSDLALYQAKNSGRNTWRFYDQAMTARITERRELEKNLRVAIRNQEFSLRYQPRYQIRSGRICGAEALIRWEHPTRGLCMPDQFIGLAEENGLILLLSDWVLHRACSDAVHWDDSMLVSVNISAVEFRAPGLVERVRAALVATGLPSRRLELEVTERVMIEDAQAGLKVMTELKSLGVRLAMDDFGTGYSSLSYLKTFPFDTLKIDRSFINEIDVNAQSLSIVQAIIQLGRSLSLTVTAEGVETAQQLACLALFSCDEAQGYHLNRPMPLQAFLEVMQAEMTQPV